MSRSLTSFSQFLPLPPSVKGRDILTLNLHYNQIRKIESLVQILKKYSIQRPLHGKGARTLTFETLCQDALPSLTELKLSSNEITQIEGISKIHKSTP